MLELTYNVVLVSGIRQGDSVIYFRISILFLFPCGLLRITEWSSPCYPVGPCWLSITYIIACGCSSQTPNLSFAPTTGNLKVYFQSLWACFCFVSLYLYYFLLDSPCEWYHLFVFLCLTNFTCMMIPRSIRVAANGLVLFLLMAVECSAALCATSSSPIPLYGHLGCLHHLDLVNGASVMCLLKAWPSWFRPGFCQAQCSVGG